MSILRVRYQTIEFGEIDIHVRTLRDLQQYQDDSNIAEDLGISSANWSLFGVVWPSSLVLGHTLKNFEFQGKRILEVGCGIGLVSLLLNNLLADITATDYHPEAEYFLKQNVTLNKGRDIPFVRTDWNEVNAQLGKFDLIIGSDLLYESVHGTHLSTFIDRHARPHCEIVLVDPGRGHHAKFSKKMVALGYSHSQDKPTDTRYLQAPFSGLVLRYRR